MTRWCNSNSDDDEGRCSDVNRCLNFIQALNLCS